MPKQLSSARCVSLSQRRIIIALLVGLLAVAVVLGGLGLGRPPRWGDGINVVLISLDTTRRDRLSCYGYGRETTPHIDAIAQESLVYRHAVAVSNWTLPTHASMLSGLYPSSHGAHLVWDNATRVRHDSADVDPSGAMHPSCDSLAEVLHSAGYRTGAIIANSIYLQKAYKLDQGFEEYDDRCTCLECNPSASQARVPYRDAEEITNTTIQWLGGNRKQPFFLLVNYVDPHIPYFPPPPWDRAYHGARAARIERQLPRPRHWMTHIEIFRSTQEALHAGSAAASPDALAWLSAKYDGELAFVDEQVGRLVQWLRDQGIYDRTMIVLTADHGECFGEHRLLEHGNGLYEPEVAVPMIVKLPYQRRRGWIDEGVQHVDIMPTVLEAVGVPVPAAVQGTSMLSVRAGQRGLVAEKYTLPGRDETHRYALYRGTLKFIVDAHGKVELYDLKSDPEELHNLADERTADVAALRQALATWRDLVVPIESVRPDAMRPEHEQLLRDFGYLQ